MAQPMYSTPMQAAPMNATPMQTLPTEASPAVTPTVEPVEAGAGAQLNPRNPVVDPNAFIIRGGKYTVKN